MEINAGNQENNAANARKCIIEIFFIGEPKKIQNIIIRITSVEYFRLFIISSPGVRMINEEKL